MSTSALLERTVLHAFPTPYPGEDLLSVVWRFAVREGFTSAKPLHHALFGAVNGARQYAYPRRLGALAQVLPRDYPLDAQGLLMEHSRLRYLASCRSDEMKEQLVRDAIGIEPPTRRPAGPRNRTWIRLCPECMNLAKSLHGEAYFRTIHQIREVIVCPIHGCPLQEFQMGRARIWDLQYPGTLGEVEGERIGVDLKTAHHAVAQLVSAIAQLPWRLVNGSAIAARLIDAVEEAGLLRGGSFVDNPGLVDHTRERLGDDYLDYVGLPLASPAPLLWPAKTMFNRQHAPRDATPYALILAVLGVDPGELQSLSIWQRRAVEFRSPHSRSRAAHFLARDKYRNAIQRFVAEHPNCLRSDVSRHLGTAMRFAMQWDADWLNSTVPAPHAAVRASWRQTWTDLDERATRLLPKLAEEARAIPGKPRRITKTVLLKRLTPRNRVERGLRIGRLPSLQREVGGFCETAEEYAIRRAAYEVEALRLEGKRVTLDNVCRRYYALFKLKHAPAVRVALIEMGVPISAKPMTRDHAVDEARR